MRAFADLLETTAAATDDATNRSLTTSTKVKEALRITDSNSDTIIAALIPRATALIVAWCRLARDAAGSKPTFARETLRATWHSEPISNRGSELYLPWRVPVFSIDSVVEAGTTLTVSTDYLLLGSTPGVLRRISTDTPIEWSTGKIVVTFKAGFAVTTSLATNIDAAIEAARQAFDHGTWPRVGPPVERATRASTFPKWSVFHVVPSRSAASTWGIS